MFHSKASYSPIDKNNIKPHLNNINIREGVRTATIKDKKLRRKYFTSQIFNIITILSIVIFQVKTIKTIQKLEEKNIDIERKLFAVETFINDTFGIFPEIWSDKFVVRHNALYFARLEYEQPDHSSVKADLVVWLNHVKRTMGHLTWRRPLVIFIKFTAILTEEGV